MAEQGKLGRYRVLGKLAQGGMAQVFLARHEGPKGFTRTVVIKQILPQFAEDPQFLQMFLNEARLAALINHPNVVSIIELGEDAETHSYYIVMEYIEGRDVKSVAQANGLTGARFPLELAARIIADACAGLHFAHELNDLNGAPLNIVHRDISLDNLLITYSGLVKVVDFGIARAVANEGKTAAGQVKGKFSYMAPEQLLGQVVDRRADVWSLGVTLYTLLANGKRPFLGQGPDVVGSVLYKEPDPIEQLPHELDRIVRTALSKNLETRYATARAFQDDLEKWLATVGRPVGPSALSDFMLTLFPETTDPTRSRLQSIIRQPSYTNLPVVRENELATPNPTASHLLIAPALNEPTRTVAPPLSAARPGRWQRPVLFLAVLGLLAGAAVLGRFSSEGAVPSTPRALPPSAAVKDEPPAKVPPAAMAEPQAKPPPALTLRADHAPTPAEPRAEVPPMGERPSVPTRPVIVAAVARPPRPNHKADPEPAKLAQPAPVPVAPVEAPPAAAAVRGPPGTLAFKVAPWAVVFLDGRQVATTPCEPVTVPSGLHKLRLINADLGAQKDLTVDVRPAETTTVRVKMTE